MKGLFLRGSIYWIRFTPARGAAQVQKSTGKTRESEAIEEAEGIIAAARADVSEVMGSCEAEIAAWEMFMKRDGLSKETIKSRGYILRPMVEKIGARTPKEITREKLQAWFEDRWDDYPQTAVSYLNVARWWLEWLGERGKLAMNPAEAVKVPQILPMQRRRRFLLPAQARKVIDDCESERLKFCLYCALQQGFRKLEVIEAPPSWFDLEAGLIHITETDTFKPKDREKRTIPMTDEFRAWLRDVYGLRAPFMLEPDVKHGKYRYRYDFRFEFESHMESCGFGDVTFHDLRRTFASLLVSGGVSIYKVAKWLGDELKTAENTYGHLIPQDEDINAAWQKQDKKKAGVRGRRTVRARGQQRAGSHLRRR